MLIVAWVKKLRSHLGSAWILLISMLLIAGLLCLIGGPRTRPKEAGRFPIGIYQVTKLEELTPLRELGFDSFMTGIGTPSFLAGMAKEARRLSMDMVVCPGEVMQSTFSAEARSWPVAAWYLVDEPDVKRWPAERLRSLDEKVKQWMPEQRTAFVIGKGDSARKYGAIGDVLMLDWYPVPHLPMESVADHIDTAMESLPEGKPLWAVIQAYDWRDAYQKDYARPRIGRFPTFYEIRFMSYSAIVHGARGIFYYTLEKPVGATLFDYPEEFQAVWRVVQELRSIQPILERGKRVGLPFSSMPSGLEAIAIRYHFKDYVIVMNRRGDASVKMPDELLLPRWRPLFEIRRSVKGLLTHTEDGWYLHPYAVIIFEGRLRLSG